MDRRCAEEVGREERHQLPRQFGEITDIGEACHTGAWCVACPFDEGCKLDRTDGPPDGAKHGKIHQWLDAAPPVFATERRDTENERVASQEEQVVDRPLDAV